MNNVIIVYLVYFIVKAIYLKVIYMKFHKIEIQSTHVFSSGYSVSLHQLRLAYTKQLI